MLKVRKEESNMGQFSWFTQDTNVRIQNGKQFKVCMTDNKGRKFWEECYEGYGVFGGKDYFELMAEMNGYEVVVIEEDDKLEFAVYFNGTQDGNLYDDPDKAFEYLRDKGLKMAFDGNPYGMSEKWKHPSITENGWYCDGQPAAVDPDQGFTDEELYEECQEDEEDEW